MNTDKIMPTLDSIVFNKIGKHIIDEEGKLKENNVAELIFSENENADVDEKDLKTINIKNNSQAEDLYFEYDYNVLSVYVPEELQEQIRFAVEYVMSEFDKINDAISDLQREFNVDRIGIVDSAEIELENARNHYSKNSTNTVNMCRVNLNSTVQQLKRSMGLAIEDINKIPTDRKKRLFKIKVNNYLEKEQRARMDCYYIIKGSLLYAEIALLLNEKSAALSFIDNTIQFLNSFDNEQLERVEGWNKKKDQFWIKTFTEYVQNLTDKKIELEQQDLNNIRIEKG